MNERITKARAGLILSSPFFASLALRLEIVETMGVRTMSTDSKKLWYNPKFIESLVDVEINGVIAHEVMHIVLGHYYRKGYRNHDKWQKACDYAINPILVESGFILPTGGLNDPKFKGMSAEEIYDKLPDESKSKKSDQPNNDNNNNNNNNSDDNNNDDNNNNNNSDDNNDNNNNNNNNNNSDDNNNNDKQESEESGALMGEVKQYTPKAGDSTVSQHKKEWNVAISKASAVAKARGRLPAGLKRIIDEELDTRLPWEEILSSFVVENVRNDYTWTRPNKRYLHTGLYLPRLNTPSIGTIAVIVDTSISISQKEIDIFASELKGILLTYPETEILVIYVDTEVANTETISSYNFELHAKGGGGTDFKPGFEYIEEKNISPVCVIYFTDGWCDSFPEEPMYPTLWAVIGCKNMDPPFGDVIKIVNNRGLNES